VGIPRPEASITNSEPTVSVLPAGVGISHSRHRGAVRPVHELLNAAALAQVDGG